MTTVDDIIAPGTEFWHCQLNQDLTVEPPVWRVLIDKLNTDYEVRWRTQNVTPSSALRMVRATYGERSGKTPEAAHEAWKRTTADWRAHLGRMLEQAPEIR